MCMVELGHVRPLAKTTVGRAPWPEQTVSQTFAEVATPLYQLRAVLVQGQEHGVQGVAVVRAKEVTNDGLPNQRLVLAQQRGQSAGPTASEVEEVFGRSRARY